MKTLNLSLLEKIEAEVKISNKNIKKIKKNQRGRNNPKWKEKEVIICKWCGKKRKVVPSLKGTTQFCNEKCYGQWMSENNIGENSPSWKNGITSLYMQIRTSTKYKEFVQSILKKNNYVCQLSGKKSKGDLQIHHIKGFAKILEENNITTIKEAENCKELWNEDNVIVLKEKYHMGQKIDNPNAFHRVYGKYNFTEQDFHEWFNKFKIDFKEGVS